MRQIKIFSIIITVTILIGGFVLYWFLKLQVLESKPQAPESSVIPSDFEKCIQATSLYEYFKKAKIESLISLDEKELKEFYPVEVPLSMNFPEAKIYQIPIAEAGGDVLTEPVLKIKDKYCPLTESNFQVLFAPIEKDEVIKYLHFRLVTLASSAYGREWCRKTILKEEDYLEKACPLGEIKEKRVTTLKETKDGYLVNWVYYTMCAPSGFYEVKVKVKKNGEIKIISWPKEPFISCGPGIMF